MRNEVGFSIHRLTKAALILSERCVRSGPTFGAPESAHPSAPAEGTASGSSGLPAEAVGKPGVTPKLLTTWQPTQPHSLIVLTPCSSFSGCHFPSTWEASPGTGFGAGRT